MDLPEIGMIGIAVMVGCSDLDRWRAVLMG